MSDFDCAEFYDCRDNEHLSHTDPDDAIMEWAEDCLPEGGGEAWLRKHGPVTVTGYVPREVDEKWLRRKAEWLAEHMAEAFAEEFGNPEGDGDEVDASSLADALLPALQHVVGAAKVWACRAVGHRAYSPDEVIAIVRAGSPGWLPTPAPAPGAGEQEEGT